MIRYAIVLMIAAAFSTAGWAADESQASKFETIGLGSGGAVGAAAGGPVGFIVGAAVGAWLGDQFNRQHRARDEFEQNWMASETRATELDDLLNDAEQQASSMESQVSALESRLRRETQQLRTVVRDALDVQVLFRTDEDTLPDGTQQRLVRLAGALASLDDMLVRIEGHADARGETDHNEQLSAKRAAAVMGTLIRAGVPVGRISMDHYGEQQSSAAENDLDGLAMARRVRLTVLPRDDDTRVTRKSIAAATDQ